MRQRRGSLLRQVLADGPLALDAVDGDIAAGLARDGLVTVADGYVHAPA